MKNISGIHVLTTLLVIVFFGGRVDAISKNCIEIFSPLKLEIFTNAYHAAQKLNSRPALRSGRDYPQSVQPLSAPRLRAIDKTLHQLALKVARYSRQVITYAQSRVTDTSGISPIVPWEYEGTYVQQRIREDVANSFQKLRIDLDFKEQQDLVNKLTLMAIQGPLRSTVSLSDVNVAINKFVVDRWVWVDQQ